MEDFSPSPLLSSSKTEATSNYYSTKNNNDECCMFDVFDKYIKVSNNLLPLQAYLQYLENDLSTYFFTPICFMRTQTTANKSSNNKSNISNQKMVRYLISNTTSTLGIINMKDEISSFNNKQNLNDTTNIDNDINKSVILAQRTYKIILAIDYSPHTSRLNFIQKSLEQTFNKINREYQEFYNNCSQMEPQIYVTVLLWHSAYITFQNETTGNISIPFKVVCHSKRLLNSNIEQMAEWLFKEINDLKYYVLELFKNGKQKK
jgi:hypothetical protein